MSFRVLAFLLLFTVGGCVSVPNQPYNKSANGHVKKIALVSVSNPAEYDITMVVHPGASFGLIGALVAAADMSSKSKTFSEHQLVRELALGREITAALNEAFAGNGFEIMTVDGGDKARKEFLKEYPSVECDAFLDVAIARAGYQAQFSTTPYVPIVYVPVRLVDARNKTVLYTASVFVTDGQIPKGGVHVTPDSSYAFSDFSALQGDPDKATKGLKDSARRVANQIAADLK